MTRKRDSQGRFVADRSQDGSGVVLDDFLKEEMDVRSEILMNLTGNAGPFLRSALLDVVEAGDRNVDRDCGYPGWAGPVIPEAFSAGLAPELFKHFYDREPIATRVVEVFPKECWQVTPKLIETEDEKLTPFEKAWEDLSLMTVPSTRELSISDSTSKFRARGGRGNLIWRYLKQLDILSGIGFYGVLFLGFNDGRDLDQPVLPREYSEEDRLKLNFIRVFSQPDVKITKYEDNIRSPRFGYPVMYQIDFMSPDNDHTEGVGVSTTTRNVHWTRVIHAADDDEVFGVPRQRPVFNRLWDLRKLYGGSAEMYWKGALPGLSLEIDPNLALAKLDKKAKFDVTDLKEQLQLYMNGLQRWLLLNGIKGNSLAPQVVSPTDQITVQLDAICIKTGIPKRIFLGSERGERSATQENEMWNDRVKEREDQYVTPKIIVPFVDRLIWMGVLPEPDSYGVKWPDLESKTDSERADVLGQVVTALAKYIRWDISHIITPTDLLVKFLDMERAEAEDLVKKAKAEAKKNDSLFKMLPNGNGNGRSSGGPLSGGGMSERQPNGAGV